METISYQKKNLNIYSESANYFIFNTNSLFSLELKNNSFQYCIGHFETHMVWFAVNKFCQEFTFQLITNSSTESYLNKWKDRKDAEIMAFRNFVVERQHKNVQRIKTLSFNKVCSSQIWQRLQLRRGNCPALGSL